MNTRLFALALIVLTSWLLDAHQAAFAGHGAAPQWAEGRILIEPRLGAGPSDVDDAVRPLGGRALRKLRSTNVHVISVPRGKEDAFIEALKRNPRIRFAEKDLRVPPTDFIPNDPNYATAWHLPKIQAPAAWDSANGTGITVAVLDTGVYALHPDLQGKILSGYNTVSNNTDTTDIHGHGTKVSGVITAVTNNAIGVASIAWGTKVLPVRVSEAADGYAYFSDIAEGLTWAADQGARVANISYDVTSSLTVGNAAQYFRSKGGVVVVAAGNSGSNPGYSDSPDVISVSATDSNDQRTSWSSFGNYVDVSAPGAGLWSTTKDGGYAKVSGTSFASPATAAVAALVMSANSALSPDQVEQILEDSADDLGSPGWDPEYGHGRINAAAAVAMAAPNPNPGGDTQSPSVSFSTPGANAQVSGTVTVTLNASDNVGVTRVELYSGNALVGSDNAAPYQINWNTNQASLGTVTLTAYAYDAAGNSSSAARNVTVVDTTAPVVTAPADKTVEATGALTSVWLGIASAVDDRDGNLSATPSPTGPFALGTHTITWRATDSAGNTGSDTQRITVRDTTPPVVNAPADLTVQATGTWTSVNLGTASATDLVDGNVSASPNKTGPFLVGTHTITWSATDASGNTGTATQRLVVTSADVTAPVITAPADLTVEATGPLTPVNLGTASAVDNEDGAVPVTPSTTGPFAPGVHSVVWTARDSAGNTAQVTQTVTVRDTTPPVVTAPADIRIPATGAWTDVALGSATASDLVDTTVSASPDQSGPFTSGRHVITWTARDGAGNTGTATQVVEILPLANLEPDQKVAEGTPVTVTVHLSGPAPQYPVRIPYHVGGTAQYPADHDAADGEVRIDAGTKGSFTIQVAADTITGEGRETIEITLDTPVNAALGPDPEQTLTITEENLRPRLKMFAQQKGKKTRLVTTDGGPVTVVAEVEDPNPGDQHQFDWSQTNNAIVDLEANDPSVFTFDPSNLTGGLYFVRVHVTDDGEPSLGATRWFLLWVVPRGPSLAAVADTDGDGTGDAAEGYGDSDDDGIPDYLDAIDDPTVLPGQDGVSDRWLLTTRPGLRLRLGQTAFAAGRGSAAVQLGDIAQYGGPAGSEGSNVADVMQFPLGLFDFEIDGLAEPGDSAQVVVAMPAPIPAGAVYRKYHPELGWQDFVLDGVDGIASAPGADGACPMPGHSAYRDGLHTGDTCVQLTLRDGGPNDSDGDADGVIRDPGGIATVQSASGGGSGGGGGCSVNPQAPFDPVLLSWLALAAVRLTRYRARS